MNKSLRTAITTAFIATVQLQRKLDALRNRAGNLKTAFALEAAKVVATEASVQYKEQIEVYDGQRGLAFGVFNVETKKYERTDACNATRMWFVRNVQGYKAKPQNDSAVWKKIATEISTIARKGRKLPATKQRELFSALAEIEATFFGE